MFKKFLEFLTKLITMNNDIDEKILWGSYFCVYLSIIITVIVCKTSEIEVYKAVLYSLSGLICAFFGISTIHQVNKVGK